MPTPLLPLLNGFVDQCGRPAAASKLAASLGAEAFLVLLRDEATGRFRPAPGFPQTLPGGPTWREFLSRCSEPGEFACEVKVAGREATAVARALSSSDGVTITLIGGNPQVSLQELSSDCSLLIGLLKAESATAVAQGHASAALEATRRATELAAALDAARGEVAAKATELRQLNASLERRVAAEIEERLRTEDALRQAQKMEAIGQLTGGVAHDFNNLLTIIKSSTEFLRRPQLSEDRRRRYVEAIADTVDRASKLTGQLLSFARRQALKPEIFDLAERVQSISDMIRTIMGSRVRIEARYDCETCYVEADLAQFETALVNIAVNARDAMEGEGTLTIRVFAIPEMPSIRGHPAGRGAFIAVSVSDTGCGIAEDQLHQIFEPFFTTKEVGKGTGLGLSQVYGFAKQSGGDIEVESAPGRGTTFTLYLPRVMGAPERAPERHLPHDQMDTGRGRRILVVEDNQEVGRFSTQILHDLGYVTTWAANANEALQYLEQAPHFFDAVFSDVVMPGMSGIALGEEIRRRHPDLPVILTTGYSHVMAQEGRHGFELLHKPYAAEELARILNKTIQRRETNLHRT